MQHKENKVALLSTTRNHMQPLSTLLFLIFWDFVSSRGVSLPGVAATTLVLFSYLIFHWYSSPKFYPSGMLSINIMVLLVSTNSIWGWGSCNWGWGAGKIHLKVRTQASPYKSRPQFCKQENINHGLFHTYSIEHALTGASLQLNRRTTRLCQEQWGNKGSGLSSFSNCSNWGKSPNFCFPSVKQRASANPVFLNQGAPNRGQLPMSRNIFGCQK